MNKGQDAILIILVCNAILISLLESVVPIPMPVPGVKLGLANIITIIAIAHLAFKDVLLIVFIRCLVVAVLTKGITALPFSLVGGLLSAAVMWLCYKYLVGWFSIKGVSIIGAVTHNMAQLVVATVILRESVMLFYLPILLVSALVTGFITGLISESALREIDKRGIFADVA